MTVFAASREFTITKTSLYPSVQNKKTRKTSGHLMLFSKTVENVFVGQYSFTFTVLDLRHLVKYYLDERKIKQPQLVDNFPGKDWAMNFMKCNEKELSFRVAFNIHVSLEQARITKLYIVSLFPEC